MWEDTMNEASHAAMTVSKLIGWNINAGAMRLVHFYIFQQISSYLENAQLRSMWMKARLSYTCIALKQNNPSVFL